MNEPGLSYVKIHPEYYNVAPGHRGGGAMAAMVAMVAMVAGMEPEPEPEPEHGIVVEGARFDSITSKTGGSDVFITHEIGRAYSAYCYCVIIHSNKPTMHASCNLLIYGIPPG